MKLFSKTVAAAMLLVMLGVPAMACLQPDTQLTDEEKACCREMANQCGSMDMPGDHSCCHKSVQHHDVAVVKDASHISYSQSSAQVASFHLPVVPSESVGHPSVPERLRHPPPSSAHPSIEILRI
jgi:hypothetical protein